MKKVPYSNLISYYVDRPDRRALDLRQAGIPECVVLGRSFYRHAYPQLAEHCHFGVAELAYVETGHQPYRVSNQRFTLLGGEGAIIPPEISHSSDGHPSYPGKRFWLQFRLPRNTKASWLGLSPREAQPVLDMLRSPANIYAKWPSDFACRAEALFSLYDRPAGPTRSAMLRTALLSLLFDLLDLNLADVPPANETRVRKAILWTETQSTLPTSLEQLASVAGLSVSSFKRVFKAIAGIPPHTFILRKRIDHAHGLLRSGAGTVTEIAFECGFPSSQYFATAFKRITGMTPNDVLRKRTATLPQNTDGQ